MPTEPHSTVLCVIKLSCWTVNFSCLLPIFLCSQSTTDRALWCAGNAVYLRPFTLSVSPTDWLNASWFYSNSPAEYCLEVASTFFLGVLAKFKAGYLRLQIHTRNMQYLLFFPCNCDWKNVLQCYVIRTLPVLLWLGKVMLVSQRKYLNMDIQLEE